MNKLGKHIIEKFLFVLLLLLPLHLVQFEIASALFIILSILYLNNRNQKISGNFITTILPLLLIFALGTVTLFFYSYSNWDIARDIAYFLKPILLLFLGYALIHKIKDPNFIFQVFVYLGLAFAIWHIYNIITFPELFNTSINIIRNSTGLSNHVELLALVFLIISLKYPDIQIFKEKRTIYYALGILGISFILYFSRTMWVAVFILLLASFGYAKITLKALKYISLFVLLIVSFYIYLYSIDIRRNEPGISTFLYKMKIAPEEIFLPKVDLNDHASLWDHWRAYEAKMALEQMSGFQHLVGRGFGSQVDLLFVAPLDEKGMRYISHLHNGYILIYYKTGIIGLLFYLLFILHLYLHTFSKKEIYQTLPINNLISAIGIYLFFSTLIISGIYNTSSIYTLLLGALLAQYDRLKLIRI
ncbi:MAG: O-antigen ligase family protein [Bacteroidales bacterium]|nr:O-antigen ligase family protein [Bacteroidales bacterium]